jgi:hypothetical protein
MRPVAFAGNTSAALAAQFLSKLAFHTSKNIRGNISEWPATLSALMAVSPASWRTLSHLLLYDQTTIKAILLECLNPEVRLCFANIIREVVANAYISLEFGEAKQFAQDLFVTQLLPLLQKVNKRQHPDLASQSCCRSITVALPLLLVVGCFGSLETFRAVFQSVL